MNHLKSFEERRSLFFQKAASKFGDQYSYEKFEYVNAKTKSTVTCKDHGDFEQNPDKHLNSTYACPDCLFLHRSEQRKGRVSKGTPMSPETYISRLNLPDHFELDMSGYLGFTKGTVVLTCPVHGKTSYHPQALMANKSKCAKCGHASMAKAMTKTYTDFISEARELYGDFYEYPDQPFQNRRGKVRIICPEHGEFLKTPQKHLSGQECSPCTLLRNISEGKYPGGYSRKVFTQNPELATAEALVYYLRVGDLYKIGITAKPINQRVKTIKHESKLDVSVMSTYSCPLLEAYEIEQKILEDHSEHRVYRPWSTELFSVDILSETTIEQYRS